MRLERQTQPSSNRADNDDSSPLTVACRGTAQQRQCDFVDLQHAKIIHIELLASERHWCAFRRTSDAESRTMDDGIQSGESAENARDVSRLGDVHFVGKQFASAKTLSLRNAPVRIKSHRNYTPALRSEHPRSCLADTTRASGDQCHRPSIILDWFHVYYYRAVVVSESRYGDSSRMEQATC